MSDLPPTVIPDPSQHWGAPPPIASGRPARWPTLITLMIALTGVAIGFVGWFRPVAQHDQPPPKPTYSDQQAAEAKSNVCAAFAKVDRALDVLNAHHPSGDPTSILAVATSTRQVLEVSSRYLLTKLTEQPATPTELAKQVREFADSSQELVVGYLDGLTVSDAELQPSLHTGDETTLTIRGLCK